jgi:hypothetical protein
MVGQMAVGGSAAEPSVAQFYAHRHDADQTFVWLDRAYSAHDYVWYIRSDPNFEPIRSDPRYTQLLKKWGLIA